MVQTFPEPCETSGLEIKEKDKLSPQLLQEWGQSGWIPAPGEKSVELVKRVDFLQRLKRDPYEVIDQTSGKLVSVDEWKPVIEKIEKQVGCKPLWLVSFYSNRKLMLWHGAVSWIYKDERGIRFPLIQLRKKFTSGNYFGYRREEVLFHEALHALRAAYPESCFEEILTYSILRKRWRRLLGPLFRRPRHVGYLMLLLSFFGGVQLLSYWNLAIEQSIIASLAPLAPSCYLGFLFWMLFRDQRIFKCALEKVKALFVRKEDAFAVVFRLTDREIRYFAQKDIPDLHLYIRRQTSLRWQQILLQFPVASDSKGQ
ncbi:MAG: hypothetical protein AAF443_01150 [Chlamydiota bacterium]